MDVSAVPNTKLGTDEKSYGFDGYLVKKWHQGAEQYGREWKIGDIVGCFLDLNDRTISYSLNGELLLVYFNKLYLEQYFRIHPEVKWHLIM